MLGIVGIGRLEKMPFQKVHHTTFASLVGAPGNPAGRGNGAGSMRWLDTQCGCRLAENPSALLFFLVENNDENLCSPCLSFALLPLTLVTEP